MTLIARLDVDGVPVFVGDTLLSTEIPVNGPVPLPSVRTSSAVHGPYPGTIAGLTQKLVCLDQHTVLAFAGPYVLAREFAMTLRRNLASGIGPEAAWKKTVRAFSLNASSGLELLFDAMIVEGERGKLFSASIGVTAARGLSSLCGAQLGGSGRRLARETLASQDRGPSLVLESRYLRAAQRALSFTANLLDLDLRDKRSFEHHFGGFYEIALWFGNRFTKLDGVQYVYWTLCEDERSEKTLFRLDRVYLQYYEHTSLCVDEVMVSSELPDRIAFQGELTLPVASILHHQIFPLESGKSNSQFLVKDVSDFVHQLTVHCCRLQLASGKVISATVVDGNVGRPCPDADIRLSEGNVVIRDKFLHTLKHQILAELQHASEADQAARAGSSMIASMFKKLANLF